MGKIFREFKSKVQQSFEGMPVRLWNIFKWGTGVILAFYITLWLSGYHDKKSYADPIIDKVVKAEGVSRQALEYILKHMGESAEGLDESMLVAKLTEKALKYKELLKEVEHLTSDDPKVTDLRTQARKSLEKGRIDEAEKFFQRALLRDLDALGEQESRIKQRRLSAAESYAAMADTARLRFNSASYRKAAQDYAEAANLVAPVDPAQARVYQEKMSRVLYDLGNEFGNNDALRESITLQEKLLATISRYTDPLSWVRLQSNMGIALTALGSRESDTANLHKAVFAYKQALKECTREGSPLDWAMTQNNLGNALLHLGERENSTENLKKAITAYEEALKERTRERVPLDWATIQNNLGSVLLSLSKRESDTENLQKAVAAYEEALTEYTRERVPLHWATIQNNLGIALGRVVMRFLPIR